MTRRITSGAFLGPAIAVFGLVASAAADPGGDRAAEIPTPFAPFEHLTGAWKGTGIPAANRVKGWSERHLWAWKFEKGRPVGMTLTLEGDKVLTQGTLSYDQAAKRYTLAGTDPEKRPVAFAGALDATGRVLTLDRLGGSPGQEKGKERLTLRLNSNQIRYTMWLDHQEPGAPQFSRLIEMNLGKEGESFAAGASVSDLPRCIVTGGAATLSVSYEGKTYPLCCTGCREEFLDDPARYVKKAALRAQAAEKGKPKAAASPSVGKDDGAFEGLVDDAPAAKARPVAGADTRATPAAKAAEPEPDPEVKAEPKAKAGGDVARAAALLRSGQSLEKLGKASAALGYYRQVVSKYPNTPQARTASARIKALSK